MRRAAVLFAVVAASLAGCSQAPTELTTAPGGTTAPGTSSSTSTSTTSSTPGTVPATTTTAPTLAIAAEPTVIEPAPTTSTAPAAPTTTAPPPTTTTTKPCPPRNWPTTTAHWDADVVVLTVHNPFDSAVTVSSIIYTSTGTPGAGRFLDPPVRIEPGADATITGGKTPGDAGAGTPGGRVQDWAWADPSMAACATPRPPA
jgi:hypothetical protein